jgi:hypothetical protein
VSIIRGSVRQFGAAATTRSGTPSVTVPSRHVALYPRQAAVPPADASRSGPACRRRNLITLAAAGRRRMIALDTALSGVQNNVFAALSDEERRLLVDMLTRVIG